MANDHYVPQFLLRNYTSTPTEPRQNKMKIWQYDRSTHAAEEKCIKEVAQEQDYYGNPALEKKLSRRETNWAKTISDLVGAWHSGHLTPASMQASQGALASFAAFQKMRTPVGRFLAAEAMHTTDAILGPDEGAPSIEERAQAAQSYALAEPELTPAFRALERVINRMKGVFIENQTAQPFWIGDSVVVARDQTGQGGDGGLRIDDPDVGIYLPLHPRLWVLLVHKPSFPDGTCLQAKEQDVQICNTLQYEQAMRYVFSSNQNFGAVMSCGQP